MATFGADAFTDTAGTGLASHTPTGGGTWTELETAGDALISDANRVRSNSASVSSWYHSGAPASADYDVSIDIYHQSVVGSQRVGVIGRASTSTPVTYYTAYHNGTDWTLLKWVSGTFTSLGTYAQTLTAGVTYALKLEMRGTAIKAFVDGVERISATDSAISAAGKAGIWVRGSMANNTGAHVDNYVAADPASAGPTYTLTAGTGSFTLTGNATGLRAGRKLAAATGSFTLTGQSVGLVASRRLTAGTGTYTLTGSAAGLRAGRKLVAAPGAFSLGGSDVLLLAGRKLSAGTGTFTLTNNPVTLTWSGYVAPNPVEQLDGSLVITRSATGTFTITRTQTGALTATRTLTATLEI